ncbi:putative tail fiber protein [Paracoccus phage vB_PmaP_KLEP18-1]|nr:putative tail fiber protein [Paracoccus phage vB_PmaP_KLEP18-1]
MAIENGIRLSELPEGAVAPARVYGIGDNTSLQFTPRQVVDAGRPMATNAEAVAGVSIDVAMNPENTRVAIDARVSSEFAPLIEDAQQAAEDAQAAAEAATAAAAGVAALYTVPDYATAVLVAGTLPAEVLVISADVDGVETRWIRDPAGTALGGGWTAAERATARNYGEPSGAALAAAVVDNVGGSVIVDYDPDTLPTDYRDVVMEQTVKSRNRNFFQTAFSVNQSHRILRTAAGAHPDRTESAMHTEMLAWGSTKNGPASATVGNSIYLTKRGYASGSAVGGEIDALEIFMRQDGPDGLPNGDPGSSDCAALMINAQNVGTCGFVSVMDATSSNLTRTAGFPIEKSMQVQAGVITANAASGIKDSYGFAAVMKIGQGLTAFQAGSDAAGGASWQNVIDSPAWRVTWGGDMQFKTAAYTDFGGRILRGTGLNGQMLIANKGTGGIAITATEAAAITFSTQNTPRWQVTAAGSLFPSADLTVSVGDATRRVNFTHTNALVVYGNNITAATLSTYADNAAALAGGLTAGRFYKTAAGDLRIVV